MDQAPKDILLLIFPALDGRSLARASRVCKHWNSILCDERIWEKFLQDLPPLISNRYQFKSKAVEYGFRSTIENNFRMGRAEVKLVMNNAHSTGKYEPTHTVSYCGLETHNILISECEEVDYGGSYGSVASPYGTHDVDISEERFYNEEAQHSDTTYLEIMGEIVIGTSSKLFYKKPKWGERMVQLTTGKDFLWASKDHNPQKIHSSSGLFIPYQPGTKYYVPKFVDLKTMKEKFYSDCKFVSVSNIFYFSPYLIDRQSDVSRLSLKVSNLEHPKESIELDINAERYTTNGHWLVIGKREKEYIFSIDVGVLPKGELKYTIPIQTSQPTYTNAFNDLYVDNVKLVALLYSEFVRIYDVKTGQLLSCMSFAFRPYRMQIVDGKMMLSNNADIAVVSFDKQNLDDEVQVLIVQPNGTMTSETIKVDKLCDFAIEYLKAPSSKYFESRYWYKTEKERVYAIFSLHVERMNPHAYEKEEDEYFKISKFLPLGYQLDKNEKLTLNDEKEELVFNERVTPKTIRGPVILYMEKKLHQGWQISSLTKELFEEMKKKKN